MSGICGFLDLSSGAGASDAASCRAMALAVGVDAPEEVEVAVSKQGPAAGLGASASSPGRPGRSETRAFSAPGGKAEALVAYHGELRDERFKGPDVVREFLKRHEGQAVKDWTELFRSLDGDFAVAVWDPCAGELIFGVDRFRRHPIYYWARGGQALFATRLAALSKAPLKAALRLDLRSIVDVAGFSIVATPASIYQEVFKVPPGCLARFSASGVRIERYWEIQFDPPSDRPVPDLERQTRDLLLDAVAALSKRDAAIGTVGAFLSGGVDSSTVVGLLTKVHGGTRSFSIGFGDAKYNEISYARIAAQAFRSDHTEYFVNERDVVEGLSKAIRHFDEPFGNASAIPAYFCAKVAAEKGVRFLYAGDGGDELFAGNERYALMKLFDYYKSVPGWLRAGLIEPAARVLGNGLGLGIARKAEKYIQRARVPYPERFYGYQIFKTIGLEEVFDDSLLREVGRDYNPYHSFHELYAAANGKAELDKQLYIDLKMIISDNDLLKVTKMTEAAGVVVRFPFLDTRLVEFAARIPARIKMRGRRLRSFFKKTYADLLPQQTILKTKHGFGLPIPEWLRTDAALNAKMKELLLDPGVRRRGWYRPGAMEDLIERHRQDRTSFYGTLLWNLMVLELWLKEHCHGQ
jgi:asparagine synthase (glutamine-hydrolysing)